MAILDQLAVAAAGASKHVVDAAGVIAAEAPKHLGAAQHLVHEAGRTLAAEAPRRLEAARHLAGHLAGQFAGQFAGEAGKVLTVDMEAAQSYAAAAAKAVAAEAPKRLGAARHLAGQAGQAIAAEAPRQLEAARHLAGVAGGYARAAVAEAPRQLATVHGLVVEVPRRISVVGKGAYEVVASVDVEHYGRALAGGASAAAQQTHRLVILVTSEGLAMASSAGTNLFHAAGLGYMATPFMVTRAIYSFCSSHMILILAALLALFICLVLLVLSSIAAPFFVSARAFTVLSRSVVIAACVCFIGGVVPSIVTAPLIAVARALGFGRDFVATVVMICAGVYVVAVPSTLTTVFILVTRALGFGVEGVRAASTAAAAQARAKRGLPRSGFAVLQSAAMGGYGLDVLDKLFRAVGVVTVAGGLAWTCFRMLMVVLN